MEFKQDENVFYSNFNFPSFLLHCGKIIGIFMNFGMRGGVLGGDFLRGVGD